MYSVVSRRREEHRPCDACVPTLQEPSKPLKKMINKARFRSPRNNRGRRKRCVPNLGGMVDGVGRLQGRDDPLRACQELKALHRFRIVDGDVLWYGASSVGEEATPSSDRGVRFQNYTFPISRRQAHMPAPNWARHEIIDVHLSQLYLFSIHRVGKTSCLYCLNAMYMLDCRVVHRTYLPARCPSATNDPAQPPESRALQQWNACQRSGRPCPATCGRQGTIVGWFMLPWLECTHASTLLG